MKKEQFQLFIPRSAAEEFVVNKHTAARREIYSFYEKGKMSHKEFKFEMEKLDREYPGQSCEYIVTNLNNWKKWINSSTKFIDE